MRYGTDVCGVVGGYPCSKHAAHSVVLQPGAADNTGQGVININFIKPTIPACSDYVTAELVWVNNELSLNWTKPNSANLMNDSRNIIVDKISWVSWLDLQFRIDKGKGIIGTDLGGFLNTYLRESNFKN